MLKVGLTGSIAVGKSFVLEIFRELGCFVLDADRTARDVVEPGEPAFAEIVKSFGREILAADGMLDRPKLGDIVFNDPVKRELLNSIVHPRVIEAQDRWLRQAEQDQPGGIAVIDAALMIESGGYKRFDKLIVVWCDRAVQLERLMTRNGINEAEAKKRIAAQMSQEEKKTHADFLIDTSTSREDSRRQTCEVFDRLKLLI
jgi:dephospho-CoA kinase